MGALYIKTEQYLRTYIVTHRKQQVLRVMKSESYESGVEGGDSFHNHGKPRMSHGGDSYDSRGDLYDSWVATYASRVIVISILQERSLNRPAAATTA